MEFKFTSVGPIGTNECYRVHLTMTNPNAGNASVEDEYVDSLTCGTQAPEGATVKFTIRRPPRENNYGNLVSAAKALNPNDIPNEMPVKWYVEVVQNTGRRLSPPSAVLQFNFRPSK